MIKKYLIIICLFFAKYSSANATSLQVLCGNNFFEAELTTDSKKYFNEHIADKQFPTQTFDFNGKTIQDYDASELYLKNFNFNKAKLINFNLRNARLIETLFDGTIFKNVDFYGTDLKDVKFTNCKFIRCNLENTDLSKTTLEGCKFKKVKLQGARLEQDLVFDNKIPPTEWVKLYAQCIQNKDQNKANVLNKLFGAFKLKLKNADLNNLNLTDINWGKADLQGAQLQGTCLSDTLLLPSYEDHAELVKLYSQFIINNKIDNAKALNTVLGRLSLDLTGEYLNDLNLTGINLSNADLLDANLTNTNLTEANLKYTDLNTNKLKGVILSDTLTLQFNDITELFYKWLENGPHKTLYQKLVNAQVPLFPSGKLPITDWSGLDLRNTKLSGIDFTNAKFIGTNLKKADIYESNFSYADLTGANLKKLLQSEDSIFYNTKLIKANLKGANLSQTELNGAWLSEDLQIHYEKDINELFKEWAKNDHHRPLYQKLINAKVEIIDNIPAEELTKINWNKIDLRNSYINSCKFNHIDFKNVKFKNSYINNCKFNHIVFENVKFRKVFLFYVTFNHCDFINSFLDQKFLSLDTNLLGNCFHSCRFFNQTVDGTPTSFVSFDQCSSYDDLVNKWIDKVDKNDISNYSARLIEAYSSYKCKKIKKLFNVHLQNLKTNLKGKNLQNIDLKNIYLASSNLENANLSGSDLRKAYLARSNLVGADLNGVKLSINDLIKNQWLNVKLSYDFVITEVLFGFGLPKVIQKLQARGVLIEQEANEPLLKKIKLEK